MTELYPLKFLPIFKDKIWGGQKIRTILNKDFGELDNCGESWEISGVSGDVSLVKNGPLKGQSLVQLIETYKQDLVGKKVYSRFGLEFPLLIKFIDANEDLSIQVHPDDHLARERHDCNGKTEMWYILQADPGSKLISGFNRIIDRETYLEFFNSGRLTELLNSEEARKGDVFFLPAGRVHTIGKGLLLAEIQQTSDITYRIYDFDRIDKNGDKRELHTDLALDALDFKHYENYKTLYPQGDNEVNEIVRSPYFQTEVLNFTQPVNRDYSGRDSFTILICLEGAVEISTDGKKYDLKAGESILIPADSKSVVLEPVNNFRILETFVP